MNEQLKKQTVLIVDDEAGNINILTELLMPEYEIRIAKNGEKALQIIFSDDRPDLILLDVMMPGMDGYEVCRRIKSVPATQDIPVIFLTAKSKLKDEERGFNLGAVDYITKPISPPIVIARVMTQLQLKKVRDFLIDKNEFLEQEVARRTKEVSHVQDVTVFALASLAETRDNETGKHIKRTQHYVKLLARGLKNHPRFRNHLSEVIIDLFFKTAPLHDIGKVGIPDHILLKPAKLTPAEFDIMKTHTRIGRNAILNAEKLLKAPAPYLFYAREIAYTHHEKWNGTGYPEGISGSNIPVSGRIMAIADVYDALVTKRIYKPAFTHPVAIDIMKDESGHHFDPEMVAVFLETADQFYEISQQYSD
ncbi:MAG: two-component system response regulator [Deltaproteobacteria bacterium]